MVGIEIAHAYGTQLAILISLLKSAIGTVSVAERLVKKHQVDILRTPIGISTPFLNFTVFISKEFWYKGNNNVEH